MKKSIVYAGIQLLLILFPGIVMSQISTEDFLTKDSIFWNAYNNCDSGTMRQLITDDIEFYHDQNGVLVGKEVFLDVFQKYLCGNKELRLRRVPDGDNIEIALLRAGENIYGAIISGLHSFYITETGKPEILSESAKFMTLWIIDNDALKMSRVFSFDHESF